MEIIENGNKDLFRVKCEYCGCQFQYKTADLGYRAWYPHGFVYCPSCKKPLRHKLEYRVNPDGKTVMEGSEYSANQVQTAPEPSLWKCSECGKSNDGNFCSACGTPKPDTWICVVCGNENKFAFCPKCGAKKPE